MGTLQFRCSLGASALLIIASATYTVNVLDFGAIPDNSTINTYAIQSAITNASQAGGGYVLIPQGVFKTGTVNLTSNVYITFDDGAFLQGSSNTTDYSWDWDYWHVVQALNATNTGLVSNSGVPVNAGIVGIMWQQMKGLDPNTEMYLPNPWTGVHSCIGECRVKDAAFIDCAYVTISGIQLLDSSDWTLLLRRTSHVWMEYVKVRNSVQWPNGDGMDIESGRNITLKGLDIATGDDSIAMRSGNCNGLRTPWPESADAISPLQDITIINCTLQSSSAAIKIEALFQLAHGNISNIVVDDVTIVPGTNRGIGIWQRVGNPKRRDGGGWISNILIRNVFGETSFKYSDLWWGSGEPLVITSVPETAAQAVIGLPGIHNVTIEDCTFYSDNGALFSARDQLETNPSALDGVVLRNVSITIRRGAASVSTWAQHDYRPLDTGAPSPNVVLAPVDALYFEHVADAVLNGVALAFAQPAQAYWDGPLVPGGGPGRTGMCINGTQDSHITIVGAALTCSLAEA